MIHQLQRIILITGHYGSGKTTFAVNLALCCRQAGQQVVLCDLDIVNPYFRSADFEGLMHEKGIETISPIFANTNLDTPSLGPGLSAAIAQPGKTVIVDVGGDDAGAIALGRYAPEIARQDYCMLYIYNPYRYLTMQAADALEILREIEAASRLRCHYIIGNPNLGEETDADTVKRALPACRQLAKESGLPVLCVSAPQDIAPQLQLDEAAFPLTLYVKKPWEA